MHYHYYSIMLIGFLSSIFLTYPAPFYAVWNIYYVDENNPKVRLIDKVPLRDVKFIIDDRHFGQELYDTKTKTVYLSASRIMSR